VNNSRLKQADNLVHSLLGPVPFRSRLRKALMHWKVIYFHMSILGIANLVWLY